jgi:3D (Asp-Asp-Asp) domain-containing protein
MAKTPGADSELRLPPVTAKLRNTHYYTIFESDYAGDPSSNVIDVSGRVLATVSAKFYKDLLMEGSGIARTGRVLNYTAKVGGVSRYEISPNPWGNGVGHCALRPFHTIAVDRSVIPLGSTVYIDETKGMPLPDGTLHDGIWRADDIGSAIQKDRVDLYVGKRAWNTALSHYKIDHLQALSVRILALPDGESCVHH